MKTLTIVLATLALMTAVAMPAASASAEEHPSDTVCLIYPPLPSPVIGCASGTIGSLPPTGCGAQGCTVALTADLTVTAVACGWLELRSLTACAHDPSHPEKRSGLESRFFEPGPHTVYSDLCISDPTGTVTAPCKELVHNFVVPSTSTGENAAMIVHVVTSLLEEAASLIANDDASDGCLVYASATFRVYKTDEDC